MAERLFWKVRGLLFMPWVTPGLDKQLIVSVLPCPQLMVLSEITKCRPNMHRSAVCLVSILFSFLEKHMSKYFSLFQNSVYMEILKILIPDCNNYSISYESMKISSIELLIILPHKLGFLFFVLSF